MNPAPTDPSPLPPATGAAPEYEFTADQNAVIDSLARSLSWVGIPLVVLAALFGANAVLHAVHAGQTADWYELAPAGLALLGAVFYFVLSNWLGKAAAAFNRVAHTSGYDVTHLMGGLTNLAKTFGVLALLVQVYVALAVVLLVTSLVLYFVR